MGIFGDGFGRAVLCNRGEDILDILCCEVSTLVSGENIGFLEGFGKVLQPVRERRTNVMWCLGMPRKKDR